MAATQASLPRTPEWAQKYPPLVTIFVAVLLAIAVLPSALTLPQTNPTQTLEYAPVPPEDNEPPPSTEGNFSSLGLGASQSIDAGGAAGGNNVPVAPPAVVRNPSTKRCVGTPPRQTEDPVAPPCVAYFAGDNGGATYQGVTREEIRLLIYIDSGIQDVYGSKGTEPRPEQEYYDLFEPPPARDTEHTYVKVLRSWQRYFNERYQTYGRVAHFFVYFAARDRSPEARRADAADNFAKVRPFAVLTDAADNEVDYVDAMAKKGVLNFGTYVGKSEKYFRSHPKLIWGYEPTVEYQAETYASYVCQKVVNQPVAISGNPAQNGQKRKLGLWHTSDENWPGLLLMAELVKKKVQDCGGEIAVDATFPRCCYHQDNSTRPDYAANAAAEFQQAGVTTILWPQGIEGNLGKAFKAIGYFPEWILLGDGYLDGNGTPRMATTDENWDDKAVVVTSITYRKGDTDSHCTQAYREVDRDLPKADMGFACSHYRNLVQFFTGVQVAGPKLNPDSIDKGFHAIPAVASKDPTVPACFYEPGDYTCVKDVQFEIWDAQTRPANDNQPGCWMSFEGGKRYLPTKLPPGNIDAQRRGDEPCNAYDGGWIIDPA